MQHQVLYLNRLGSKALKVNSLPTNCGPESLKTIVEIVVCKSLSIQRVSINFPRRNIRKFFRWPTPLPSGHPSFQVSTRCASHSRGSVHLSNRLLLTRLYFRIADHHVRLSSLRSIRVPVAAVPDILLNLFPDLRPDWIREALLQLRVLGFGLAQDGDIRIGVLPQTEKLLVCSARFGSGVPCRRAFD